MKSFIKRQREIRLRKWCAGLASTIRPNFGTGAGESFETITEWLYDWVSGKRLKSES
jgi:hypothetical protein